MNKIINQIIKEYKLLMKSYVAIVFVLVEAAVMGVVSTLITLIVTTIIVGVVLGIKEYISNNKDETLNNIKTTNESTK